MKSLVLRSAVVVALLGSARIAGLAAQQPGPDPVPRFKSSADVVTIQAAVRNGKGRPVPGLTAADFEIRDNGQLRPVLSLRSDAGSPVSLAILVDMSGSMVISPKLAMARQALASVISRLRPGEDEAAVFTFDSTLHDRHPFTKDPSRLSGALDNLKPYGTTSLYDATAAAARRLSQRSATHKAIVLLTDGFDTSSRYSAPEVSGLASSIAVPVYVMATVPSIDQRIMMEAAERSDQSNAADLRDLAEWTGGQLLFASTLTETTTAAVELLTELRQQYVIAIEAVAAREWRRLDVRVKRPSAVVRARNGYYGG